MQVASTCCIERSIIYYIYGIGDHYQPSILLALVLQAIRGMIPCLCRQQIPGAYRSSPSCQSYPRSYPRIVQEYKCRTMMPKRLVKSANRHSFWAWLHCSEAPRSGISMAGPSLKSTDSEATYTASPKFIETAISYIQCVLCS